jgi:hypothetical protein
MEAGQTFAKMFNTPTRMRIYKFETKQRTRERDHHKIKGGRKRKEEKKTKERGIEKVSTSSPCQGAGALCCGGVCDCEFGE